MATNIDNSPSFVSLQDINFNDGKELSSLTCLENETILGHDKNLNEIMEDLESLSSFKTIDKDEGYDCKILESNHDDDSNNIQINDSSNEMMGIFEIEDDSKGSAIENYETSLNENPPEQVEDVAINLYYSSGESIADSVNSSASTASKKRKKRFCKKCGVYFRKRRDLLAHVKTHVALPVIKIKKLSDSHKIVKEYLNTVAERAERKNDAISCEQTGELKLKLKMSGSQNFEVVPHPDLKKKEIEKVEPTRIKGIRVVKAQDIKWTPPPIETTTSEMHTSSFENDSSKNLGNNVKEEPLANRYFECPALDGLEQFTEEMNPEKTEDLLKKLLAGGQQDFSATEVDWPSNTNEFISIDSLAHMCTVCHSRFANGRELFEHKKITRHDFNNPMQPPPPPAIQSMMDMNNCNRPRGNFFLPGSSQPRQFGYDQNGSRQLLPPARPNLQLRFNHMLPTHTPSSRSTFPRLHAQIQQHQQLNHQQQQQHQQLNQQQQQHQQLNQQQQMMIPRRIVPPPPLYRFPGQNIQETVPPYGATSGEMFRQQINNSSNRFPSNSTQQTNQDLMRQSVFLKSRLQKNVHPRANFSPNNSPSPPILSQQTAVRPRFLLPQNPDLNIDSQQSSNTINGQPPSKKNKIEPTFPPKVGSLPFQALRKEGVPIIQSVHSGASAQNLQEKSKEQQIVDINLSNINKIKETNKNPKDVANLLATRGIIVTHKGKAANASNASNASETQSSSANVAVQKLQLNNSVSIITKKKEEQIVSSNGKNNAPAEKTISGSSKFLPCPIPNCQEKFLTIEYLHRHTSRDHHISRSNLERSLSDKILRAYKCKTCSALFSTQEALVEHQNRSHRSSKTTADEIGIPIIDLRNEDTKKKLALLGITNYIPLSNKNTNGFFGFPIVSVQGSSNPNVYNLGALGSGAILSLGPIKQIPSRNSTNDS